MPSAAAPSGLDERPSAPIAPRRPRPSARKNAHRGLAACRRPASGKLCSQALTASGKTPRSPTTARRSHLLQQSKPKNPCQSAGSAPSPQQYANEGTALAQQAASSGPSLLNGLDEIALLLQFHRGGMLDAQAQGGSPAYGNYAFGAFFAGLGWSLQNTLAAANAYGALASQYNPKTTNMSPDYPGIPSANVQNIANGYNAATAQVLCTPSG